jgi:hypothetical protein
MNGYQHSAGCSVHPHSLCSNHLMELGLGQWGGLISICGTWGAVKLHNCR